MISPATKPRCARRWPARARPARSSRSSPSWRSAATRPRICCSRSTSSPTPARRSSASRPTCTGIVALVGFPERADDAYNAAAVLADGRVQAIYRKVNLPNYGVFDELRYFQHGPGGADDRRRRRQGRADDLRGHLGARRADDRRGAGRRTAGAQHLRLPLPGGQGAPARADDRPARRATTWRRSPSARWSAARTSWSSTATRSWSTTTATSSPARAQFAEELLVCDVDVEAAGAARLRDTRARPAAREVATAVADLGSFTTDGGSDPAAPGGPVAELLDADAEIYAALVLGTRDYVDQERLPARRPGPLGRDRLHPGRPHRGRRPRARARDLRDDALALLLAGDARRRLPAGREPRGRAGRAADRRGDGGLRGPAGRRLRRARARHHRGEPAGAHPRQPPDGAVEQVRLARAHHRQQVRDVGRLLDALRRQRRRVRGDQGRARRRSSTGSWPSARAATRSRRCPSRSSPARRPPSCAPTSATRTRCRPTRCSTRSSRATSSRTSGASS